MLNVSQEMQARRFLRRIDDPSRNWKFSAVDMNKRQHWSLYQTA
jgi:polyphosphate kinase 2 (PPK2 family)